MKIYLNKSVYEAALERISFIFDEFEEVIVATSGGKDSTVLFHLTLQVAKEKGRLPLKVLFIDQEAEWQATIDLIRKIMYRKDVEPLWFQIPMKIFNATSFQKEWLYCWNPKERDIWMREKEEISIKENKYGTMRFKKLFEAIIKKEFPNKKVALLGGVTAEESPNRHLATTEGLVYKWVTWGKRHKNNPNAYLFYPLYDWSYTDIWKAIHDNKWEYNKIYDYQFQLGIPVQNMRVSNLHHETAVHSLFYIQEIEPKTYEKLVRRLKGIDATAKLGKQFFLDANFKLPYMFKDWREYRDYLVDKLVNGKNKEKFKKILEKFDKKYGKYPFYDKYIKHQINTILVNDWTGTKFHNLEVRLDVLKKTYDKLW